MAQRDLPDELLLKILDELGQEDLPTKAAFARTCRRFLPLGQALLYHHVSLNEWDSFLATYYEPRDFISTISLPPCPLTAVLFNPRLTLYIRKVTIFHQFGEPERVARLIEILGIRCLADTALDLHFLPSTSSSPFQIGLLGVGGRLRSFSSTGIDWEEDELAEVLRAMPNLQELTLYGSRRGRTQLQESLQLGDPPSFRLHFLGVRMDPSLNENSLHFLTVSSRASLNTLWWTGSFPPNTNLANFETLSTFRWWSRDDGVPRMIEVINSSSTIETIEISDNLGLLPTDELTSADLLANLPSTVRHLRLRHCAIALEYITRSLRISIITPNLASLKLSPCVGEGGFGRGPIGDEQQVEALEETCVGRGVRLMWV